MRREGFTDHGVRVMFTSVAFKETKLYVFMFCIICFILYYHNTKHIKPVSLYVTTGMWFHFTRLQACVGSLCVGNTTLMCRGRECARLGSATRCIFFYESLVGGGLRPSGPSSGSSGSVRVYIRDM